MNVDREAALTGLAPVAEATGTDPKTLLDRLELESLDATADAMSGSRDAGGSASAAGSTDVTLAGSHFQPGLCACDSGVPSLLWRDAYRIISAYVDGTRPLASVDDILTALEALLTSRGWQTDSKSAGELIGLTATLHDGDSSGCPGTRLLVQMETEDT